MPKLIIACSYLLLLYLFSVNLSAHLFICASFVPLHSVAHRNRQLIRQLS